MLTPAQQAEQDDINLNKQQLEETAQKMEKMFKYTSYGLMGLGIILCLTIFLIPVGALIVLAGFLTKKFGVKAALSETTKRLSELNVRQARLNEQVGQQ